MPAGADAATHDPPESVGVATAAPTASEAPTASDAPTDDDLPEPPRATSDGQCEISPRSILEAMLFVGLPGGHPLAAGKVAQNALQSLGKTLFFVECGDDDRERVQGSIIILVQT